MTSRNLTVATLALALLGAAPLAHAEKQTNRQVIDKWFQIVDAKQVDRLKEVESADIEMTTPQGPVKGTEARAQMAKGFATAFPNSKHTVKQCVESGDTIACEGSFEGDHTGPLATPDGKSIPATNKHVSFTWAGIAKIKGSKATKLNVYFDNMTFMQQLGLAPAPGQQQAQQSTTTTTTTTN